MIRSRFIVSSILFLLTAFTFFASASYFLVEDSSLFSNGIFNNTEINGSYLQLTNNDSLQELPNNKLIEAFYGGINMSGNILLFHFNNNSDYGENATNLFDFSGNGNNATCSGSSCPVLNQSGKLNQGYSFDGSNDYFANTSSADMLNFGSSQDFSISAWFKVSSLGSNKVIFSKGDIASGRSWFRLRVDTNNNILCEASSNSPGEDSVATSSATVSIGLWYHAVCVFDRDGNVVVYVNSTSSGSGSMSATGDLDDPQGFLVGARSSSNSPGLYMAGTVDELAVWNRSLSNAEIEGIYLRQKGDYISKGEFTSRVIDFGHELSVLNISYFSVNATQSNITLLVSNCSSSSCSDSTFVNVQNVNNNVLSAIGPTRYFSYKVLFNSLNNSYSPKISNLSLIYHLFPSITFSGPTPSNNSGVTGSFIVNATINESSISNITWSFNSVNYTYGLNYELSTPENISEDLLVQYYFNNNPNYGENATNLFDFSGNGNNATCSGSSCPVLNQSGKFGSSYDFDGVDDYFMVPYSSLLAPVTDKFTTSFWFNADSLDSSSRFISKTESGGYHFSVRENAVCSTNSLCFLLYNGSGYYAASRTIDDFSTHQWYHIVGTYNGSQMSLYSNGQLIGSNTVVRGSIRYNNNNPLCFGNEAGASGCNGGANFNGRMDDLSIWNRSLSSGEVYQLYQSELINYPNSEALFEYMPNENITIHLTADGDEHYQILINQSGLGVGSISHWSLSTINTYSLRNTSDTYVILGNSAPLFSSISTSPSYFDNQSIDPGVTIIVTSNITDNDLNIDSVLLQWTNSTSSNWMNISMENQTSKSITTIFNASLTLPNYESLIFFRLLSNDSVGLTNYSSNYSLSSYWDCSWNVTGDLGQAIGFSSTDNKFIGNLSINNTGDVEFSQNNCTLQFRITSSFDQSQRRVYIDNSYYQPSNTYTVNAGENKSISINATFLDSISQENGYLTTEEVSGLSVTNKLNTTFTLISSSGGPYLYQEITKYPSSLFLRPGNISLESYLRNLAGDGSAENATYNVSVNWSLPQDLSLLEGNLSLFYENLTDNSLHYNSANISLNSSNLPSLSPGSYAIYLYASGINQSGQGTIQAGNNTVLVNSVNLTFLCYGISDGIAVSACGSLDGDYVAPSSTSVSSGGGSGGGGSGGQELFNKAEYQFTRGKESTIRIDLVNNNLNESLNDLSIRVDGNIAKYLQLIPSEIEEILPGQKTYIDLNITSPSYISLGLQRISLTIIGKIGNRAYLERRDIIIQVNDISADEALDIYQELVKVVEDFKSAGFNYSLVDKYLDESKIALDSLDYVVLQEKAELLKDIALSAIETKETYDELSTLVAFAKEKEIDVSGTERLLKLTLLSLNRQDFEQALYRVREAKVTYALETKGEFGSLSYYVKNNPREISLAAIFLMLFGLTVVKTAQLQRFNSKLKKLKEEEEILNDLIKLVQKETFKDKKMSMEEYQSAVKYYEIRLSEVIQELIETETKKVYWIKISPKDKKLKIERQRIIDLIKTLQSDYLKRGRIETNAYELRLNSYNKRISEIDEALANLEAKQALKKMRLFKR